ncbi:MAG: DUF2480 family protein [Tunicatimonas sp.]|uniref:DUF2480 family protein n=1 Tax=Tunicatimonas sp. TaxID=1940096 RepID=UPI003C7953D9
MTNSNETEIVNRVANSSLITFDLEEYYPLGERVVYDIKDNLFQEMILREKDFRLFVKEHDWSQYQDKQVALTCSIDAIVPTWAYMLLATKLEPYAQRVIFGSLETLEAALFQEALSKIDPTEFQNAKVVVKGCGNLPVPTFAYVEITRLLRPHASTIMYGEPCSTVPLYKRPKNLS